MEELHAHIKGAVRRATNQTQGLSCDRQSISTPQSTDGQILRAFQSTVLACIQLLVQRARVRVVGS